MTLSVDDFDAFFAAAHGVRPYRWQQRLLREIVEKGWPDCVASPTGAGKTAVIDIALFHLALELDHATQPRRAPMRIALAVDRRIIVDQAFERAERLRAALTKPENPVLRRVADTLGGAPHIAQLRGGIPREDDWAKAPDRPTILCTTIDQLGSRLLFRGYGVSPSMAPVHAGLLGRDALLLLDEAHLSEPFRQTLGCVRRRQERREPDADLNLPWSFCALTATPREAEKASAIAAGCEQKAEWVFALLDAEREEASIAERLRAKKRIALVEEKVEPGSEAHVELFVERAIALDGATIAIVVNRVGLARAIRDALAARFGTDAAILLTGRARPLARDALTRKYRERLEGKKDDATQAPRLFVVATQCLEVGADYDFDAMVAQIAPLDALRQRFGRLDRAGRRGETKGAIIATAAEVGRSAKPDAIYADRAKKAWNWLIENAGTDGAKRHVDFGPDAFDAAAKASPAAVAEASASQKDAPILRAADIGFFVMTNPHPSPDPYLPLFLHGEARAEADVSIVWRADLPERLSEANEEDAKRIVACLPPRAGETLAVPVWEARNWLAKKAGVDVGDVEGAAAPETAGDESGSRKALRWRGAEDARTTLVAPHDLAPGDLLIVPSAYGGCDEFGWSPLSGEDVRDLGDEAAEPYSPRRAVLRLHSRLFHQTPELWARLAESLEATEEESAEVAIGAVRAVLDETPETSTRERVASALVARMAALTPEKRRKLQRDWYDEDAAVRGAMFVAPEGVAPSRGSLAPADAAVEEEEPAEPVTEDGDAGSFRREALELDLHLRQVADKARAFAEKIGLPLRVAKTIAFAAAWHDKGKADPRFQKYLAGGAAPSPDVLLAKSGAPMPRGGANQRARAASGLPPDWRHEVLSVRLAMRLFERGDGPEDIDAELALFLIGAHHGQGRPFFRHCDPWDSHERELLGAPLPTGAGPERLDFDWRGQDWAELFERLNARYGAWGLAYAEAVLRLADHRASEEA
jgi:CRISPR-associated endonuclease/helicase Cas3